jgi:hypothetical protein
MDTLATALRYEMLVLLIILIGIIGYRLLVQQINTNGLLLDKTGGRKISPARLQMLVVTVGIALYYIFMVIEAEDMGRLPDMPNEFLVALGGSHAIYLAGKLHGMLASKLKIALPTIRERAKPGHGG